MDSSCFSQLETNSSFVAAQYRFVVGNIHQILSTRFSIRESYEYRRLMEGRSLFLRHRPHSSHAFRITLCERKFLSFRSEKTGKFEGWERSLEPPSSRPQDLRSPRPTSFQIIPSLPASNYKRQLYVPSLQWIMPLILENTGEERTWTAKSARRWDVRSSKRKKEGFSDALRAVIVHWLLGDTLECRRISSLPAVGRNSMGAPPKGIPTYLLEAPDLPSASCLCLRRKRYFFGYYPVAGVESCWCVPASPRLSLRNTCV